LFLLLLLLEFPVLSLFLLNPEHLLLSLKLLLLLLTEHEVGVISLELQLVLSEHLLPEFEVEVVVLLLSLNILSLLFEQVLVLRTLLLLDLPEHLAGLQVGVQGHELLVCPWLVPERIEDGGGGSRPPRPLGVHLRGVALQTAAEGEVGGTHELQVLAATAEQHVLHCLVEHAFALGSEDVA